MRKKKAVLFCLTAIMMVIFGFMAYADNVKAADEDWEYYISKGYAVVSGYTGMETEITIPRSLGGYKVNAIGEKAFDGNNLITSTANPNR